MLSNPSVQLAEQEVAENWARVEYDRWRAAFRATPNHSWACEVREIASANVERVEKELARVTKLCKKYGQGEPVVQFSPTQYPVRREREVWQDGELIVKRYTILCRQMVTVSPELIGQEGWRIVAKVTHLPGEGNAVIAAFPGEAVPHFQQFNRPECEHCNTIRRRNETFVVSRLEYENENGRLVVYKQVGTNCLQEYLGIDPGYALALAGWYEATGQVNDTDRYEEPLDDWLRWVAVAVRLDGRYWSKQAAEEADDRNRYDNGARYGYREQQTTVNHTYSLINAANFDYKAAEQGGEVPTDADRETAEQVKAWVLTLNPDLSQYHANLVAVFRAGVLVHGTHALAASAFSGFLREREQAERAKQQATLGPSQWVGNQGDKVDLGVVKVTSVKEIDGAYGVTYLYRFLTGSGNVLVWFSSNDMGLSAGDLIGSLKGTIKKLDEFRGEKQTVLARCKVVR